MRTRSRRLMAVVVGLAAISVAAVGLLALQSTATAQPGAYPVIKISVQNLNTFTPVQDHTTVPAGTPLEVRISTNGVDCAGQLVVTAHGAPGAPPSVLVKFMPFIVGPFVGTDFAAATLTAGVKPDGTNAFKISASCNGAAHDQFAFDRFEFFAQAEWSWPPYRRPGTN